MAILKSIYDMTEQSIIINKLCIRMIKKFLYELIISILFETNFLKYHFGCFI